MTTIDLRRVPALEGVSEPGLERLAAAAALVEVEQGQILAQIDDPGSGAFVILNGTVAVELRSRTFELGPGAVVGELSLLVPDAGRVARVRTVTHTRCLAVPRDAFLELVETEPAFALALLRELARRLVEVHSAAR
jgi:CRP-like cAMP-binding protein